VAAERKETGEELRVLVTSGPTRAYVDRIRYIANTSSGALGARIVERMTERGMAVVHVRGAGSEVPAVRDARLLESHEVVTVGDVIRTVKEICSRGGIGAVVHAMAVLDYVPEERLDVKRKSDDPSWNLRLVRTPKVTGIIRDAMPRVFMVGFKLEAGVAEEELIRRAGASLEAYGLDAVVANDIDRVGPERHEALVLGPGNRILRRCETKEEIAGFVTDLVAGHILGT